MSKMLYTFCGIVAFMAAMNLSSLIFLYSFAQNLEEIMGSIKTNKPSETSSEHQDTVKECLEKSEKFKLEDNDIPEDKEDSEFQSSENAAQVQQEYEENPNVSQQIRKEDQEELNGSGESSEATEVLEATTGMQSISDDADSALPAPATAAADEKKVISDTEIEAKTKPSEEEAEVKIFSEWAEEQRKKADISAQNGTGNGNGGTKLKQTKKMKRGRDNRASPDCGAKIVSANPNILNVNSVLKPMKDEYLLSDCTVKLWFVVQLCEPCQIKTIELSNYELFSSSPREFVLYMSDRLPTRERDWVKVGQFEAMNVKISQVFGLEDNQYFGKYVKVEVLSHWGKEHYCPISSFKAFGVSEYEVLQEEPEKGPDEVLREDDESFDKQEHDDTYPDDLQQDDKQHIAIGRAHANSTLGSLLHGAKEGVKGLVQKFVRVLSPSGSSEDGVVRTQDRECMSMRTEYNMDLNIPEEINEVLVTIWISCHYHFLDSLRSIKLIDESLDKYVCTTDNHSTTLSPLARFLLSVFDRNALYSLCYIKSVESPVGKKSVSENVTISQTTEITGSTLIKSDMLSPTTVGSGTSVVLTTHVTEAPVIKTISDMVNDALVIQPTKTKLEMDTLESLVETSVDVQSSYADEVNHSVAVDSSVPTLKTEEVDEKLLNDGDAQVNTAGTEEKQVTESVTTSAPMPPIQREPQFIRLNNKIKALELNLSLTSQYLEELSRKYKRQVEDMQNGNITTSSIIKGMQDNLKQLDEKFDSMTEALHSLSDAQAESQKSTWETYLALLTIQLFTVCMVLWCCIRSHSIQKQLPSLPEKSYCGRRHSIHCVHNSSFTKQSLSEENRRLTDSHSEVEIVFNDERKRVSLKTAGRRSKSSCNVRRKGLVRQVATSNLSHSQNAGLLFVRADVKSSVMQKRSKLDAKEDRLSVTNLDVAQTENACALSVDGSVCDSLVSKRKKSKSLKFFNKIKDANKKESSNSNTRRQSQPTGSKESAEIINGWESHSNGKGNRLKRFFKLH